MKWVLLVSSVLAFKTYPIAQPPFIHGAAVTRLPGSPRPLTPSSHLQRSESFAVILVNGQTIAASRTLNQAGNARLLEAFQNPGQDDQSSQHTYSYAPAPRSMQQFSLEWLLTLALTHLQKLFVSFVTLV